MPSRHARSALRRALDLARKVTNPTRPYNYSEGVRSGAINLPENFLCFTRTASDLHDDQNAELHKQHHRTVLIHCLRGSGYVGIDTEVVALKPGWLALVQPFQTHFYPKVSPDAFWLYITFDFPAPFPGHLRSRSLHLSPGGHHTLCEFLGGWLSGATPRRTALLLALLLEEMSEGQASEPIPERQIALLQQLGHFFRDHLHRPFHLEEVARHVGLSPSRLHHLFSEVTGRPIGAHIRQLRLRRACGLLHATQQPVSEIAQQCGFDSLYSFSRAFKTAYGLSPTLYRKSPTQLNSGSASS